MSKIAISYNDKDYELEYSRQSVRMMESQGFVLEQISSKPMTMIPLLFSGAFAKNHRGLKRALIDEILENISDKAGLLNALIEMYAETLSSLTDDTESEGNATWAITK
jgi:hypothetical protein